MFLKYSIKKKKKKQPPNIFSMVFQSIFQLEIIRILRENPFLEGLC